MKDYRKYIIILIGGILCLVLLFVWNRLYNNSSDLYFFIKDKPEISDISVNGENVFNDEYDKNNSHIYSITMNTLYPTNIKIKWQNRKRKLKNIDKQSFINIHVLYVDNWKIKQSVFKLYLLPKAFPEISVTDNGIAPGYIYTSFNGELNKDRAFVVILDTTGKLIFYRTAKEPTRSVFHLQKWKIKDNKVLYSIHMQDNPYDEKDCGGYHLVLDEKFNVIDKVQISPTDEHGFLPSDEHDFILLDKNHYILHGWYDNDKDNITTPIVQEVKDKKVVFEWKLDEHMAIKKILNSIDINSIGRPVLHLNSIDIDPKDNNIVLSLRWLNTSVKIDRKTGDVIWQLGGPFDDYNLNKDELFQEQHDIHYQNGKLIIFDNKSQKNARVLIYTLDETKHKILEKEIINLNEYIPFMGSANFLPDNLLIIGCAGCYKKDEDDKCVARIINSDLNTLFQLNVKSDKYKVFYRAYYEKNK